jgi:hypothetical protein
MSVSGIKSKLHHLVDVAEDETALQAALQALGNPDPDILDILTAKQRRDLDESIKQHQTGKTISHNEMKHRISSWLTK